MSSSDARGSDRRRLIVDLAKLTAPLLVVLALLGDRVAEYARDPSGSWLLTLVGVVAALAAAGVLAGRWLMGRIDR